MANTDECVLTAVLAAAIYFTFKEIARNCFCINVFSFANLTRLLKTVLLKLT